MIACPCGAPIEDNEVLCLDCLEAMTDDDQYESEPDQPGPDPYGEPDTTTVPIRGDQL